MEHEKSNLIPHQEQGSQKDFEKCIELDSLTEAKDFFKIAQKRLFDVSHWEEMCGSSSAKFVLTNKKGQETSFNPQKGYFIKIVLPTSTEKHPDWVLIEAIEIKSSSNESESVGIRATPAPSPESSDENTAHFFSDKASSTFLIERNGKRVCASVHGRNETTNMTAEGLLEGLRNIVISIGARLGVANVQWQSLVEGLVEKT